MSKLDITNMLYFYKCDKMGPPFGNFLFFWGEEDKEIIIRKHEMKHYKTWYLVKIPHVVFWKRCVCSLILIYFAWDEYVDHEIMK